MTQPRRDAVIAVSTLTATVIAITTAAEISKWSSFSLGDVKPLLVMVCLVAGITAAYRYPLKLSNKATLQVTGVPMFLAVALLEPVPAALTVGIGIFGGEYTQRCRCSNPMAHVFTHAGRLALVALAASMVAHVSLPIPRSAGELRWIAAGATLWLGDFLTILVLLVPITRRKPQVLFASLVRQAGTQEAVQYVMGLLSALAVSNRLWALPFLVLPTALVYVALERASQRGEDIKVFLESMADAVDLRDPSTGGHSQRVAEFTSSILKELKIAGRQAETIVWAARVHDIGKIGIPDIILNKPSPLTEEEWRVMSVHPEQGAQLLARYRDFSDGTDIVRYHHERWDGSGYPSGLAGTDLPIGARIVAVADSFDAMTTERPYGPCQSIAQAAAALKDGRGTQWDPEVVEAFLRTLGDKVDEVGSRPRMAIVPSRASERTAIA